MRGLIVAPLFALLVGCAMPTQAPVQGLIYTGVEGHQSATSNPVGGKRGEACAFSILGIIAIGDASAATAAKNGGITKIGLVDSDMMGILGIYGSHCTVVHGE
ncbi:MAG: TRL-like family protein [Labilithrix sp.]|nr:TRL-like family protein [Labilithrix sp.]